MGPVYFVQGKKEINFRYKKLFFVIFYYRYYDPLFYTYIYTESRYINTRNSQNILSVIINIY